MEKWHLSYEECISMPTTRRHRMIQKKIELEQKREDRQRQAESQARGRMRR